MKAVHYRKHIEEGFYHNEVNNAYHSTDPMGSFAEQINSYDPQYVIDAGCGQNIWKNKVQNLTGLTGHIWKQMTTLVNILYLMNIHNQVKQTLFFV